MHGSGAGWHLLDKPLSKRGTEPTTVLTMGWDSQSAESYSLLVQSFFPPEENTRYETYHRIQTFHACCFLAALLASTSVPAWLMSQFHLPAVLQGRWLGQTSVYYML